MKEVRLTPEKREELNKWLMEQPFKFAQPVLAFLQENEFVEPKEKGDVKKDK